MTTEESTPAVPPALEARGISKSFGGARALDGVDFDLRPGEIHALCGENGAGKSTLIEILAGGVRPDGGTIEIQGRPVHLRSPADAARLGVAVIHQEFSLVDELTVAENLLLGHEPRFGPFLDRRRLKAEAARRLEAFGFDLPLKARAGGLPTGRKQLVEILKALGRDARVLILDEPTAALTRAEAARLFETLAALRARGMGIVYVSHHLDEVLALADRVTVLRDGRKVDSRPASAFDTAGLTSAMVGEAVDVRTRAVDSSATGIEALRAEKLRGATIRDVSFSLRRGEILGVAGLAGAGHEELAALLFGAKRPKRGTIRIGGAVPRLDHPARAIAEGIVSVPADRRRDGLLTTLDIERNLTIAGLPSLALRGWVRAGRRRKLARSLAEAFEVVHNGLGRRAASLSGGNQQKVILARWCSLRPTIVLLNDPTRGIDVKTREAIHRRIEAMAADGAAVLLATSDLQELRRLADRLIVFRRGRAAVERSAAGLDEAAILAAMTDDSPTTNADDARNRT